MKKVTFIHTGDLHLGRQFNFKYNSDGFGKAKRTDLWKTFERIINVVKKNKINLLLISGDLFDSDEIDIKEIHRVSDMLSSLSTTKVVILPGNHDYYNSISNFGLADWPENVTIFKTGKIESVYFPDLETEVFGLGWIKNAYDEIPEMTSYRLAPERNNIMMLHGDAFNKRSDYMPINISEYNSFDYVALGHYHAVKIVSENAVYCGNPEPLDFGENGKHGIFIGHIEQHKCNIKMLTLQQRKYLTKEIIVNSEMSFNDLKKSMLSVDDENNRQQNYYRFKLKGYRDFELSVDWLLEELKPSFYYIELDDSQLEPDINLEEIQKNNKDNLIGHFIGDMKNYGNDPIAKKALILGLEGLMKAGKIK